MQCQCIAFTSDVSAIDIEQGTTTRTGYQPIEVGIASLYPDLVHSDVDIPALRADVLGSQNMKENLRIASKP
jgi:hypothetical protein